MDVQMKAPTAQQVKAALKKRINKEMIYNVSAAVSNAILVTLGMGLLMQSISKMINWAPLYQMGSITMILLPAAFGAAVASQMKTNTMVMFAAMAASTVGANAVFFTQAATQGITATGYVSPQAAGVGVMTTGQPISAVAAAVVAVIFGKWITGKTPLDMVLVPAATVFVGVVSGYVLAIVTTPILVAIAKIIVASIAVSPIIGTAVIAMSFGALTMSPASAAALSVAIGATGVTSPEVAGAIMIGTAAVYAGYPVMSYQENKIGTTIAQAVVTPKIQFPNLIKRPILLLPPMIGAAIGAPIGTLVFHLSTNFTMAGIGLNSLIVPLAVATTDFSSFIAYLAVGVVIPAVISHIGYRILRAKGLVQPQDLHLEMI